MSVMGQACRILKKVPSELYYTILLFTVTRVMLTAIGLLTHMGGHGDVYTGLNDIVNMYSVWDSTWYANIAKFGYYLNAPGHMANYAFYPLYPLLTGLAGYFIGNYYAAGLVVSNICLIVSGVFLYRLVRLDEDNDTALRSIKYMFLFPTAFILSGVFSESLFLMLLILCFYFAKRRQWLYVGFFGFYLAMTRSVGVIILIPLLYEYFKSHNFKITVKPDLLCLLLIPLGLATFSAFNYYLTGDFLAFYHITSTWGTAFANPLEALYTRLMIVDNIKIRMSAIMVLLALSLMVSSYRKISTTYLIAGMVLLIAPLSTTCVSAFGMPRYLLVIFPLYIIFAKLARNAGFDQIAMISLALLQGFLMVYWTSFTDFII